MPSRKHTESMVPGPLGAPVPSFLDGPSRGMLQKIIDIGTRLVGARYGAIGILTEAGDSIQDFFTSGIDEKTRQAIGDYPTGKGILGIPIHDPAPLRLKKLDQDPRSVGFPKHHPPMNSFLGVPLSSKEKVYGNLYFTEKQDKDEFSEEDEVLAESFAELAVRAIEREHVYEDAQRARDFFRSIVDNNADAVVITNSKREIIFWNEAASQLYGYTEEEVLGRNIGLLVPPEMQDEWINVFEPQIASLFRSGQPHRFEAIRVRKDGSRVTAGVTLSPVLGRDGEIIAISGVAKDLTQTKRAEENLLASEQRYQEILENVQLISVGLDSEGKINFCNDFFLNLTGWKRNEILGRNWFETFLPAGVRDQVQRMFKETTAKGQIETHFQNEIITRTGAHRLISWNNTVLRDSEGKIAGTISIGEDITVRRQAEERALQNQKLEALGRLSSGVAHDFNNALGIIHGGAEMLERLITRKGADPDALEYLDIIQKSAMGAAHTVRRLQDFARKREDRPLGYADVNDVIRDAAEMTRPQWKSEADAEGKTIEMAIRPLASHSTVNGEEASLQEVLINLIINAIDAMPDGGRITIATEDTPEGPRISVQDTGIGMPPNVRERAFEPFFSTKGEQGTGMGLSMVFGIVHRHGGTPEIQSEEGAGTTVSFVLPATRKEEPLIEPEARISHPPARILLVEDKPDMARIVRALLEAEKHTVEIAQTGNEAIEAFSKSSHDLVITDLGVPDMTGSEVARRLKSESPNTPIILLTGWQSEMSPEMMTESGIDLVIGKPVTKKELYRAVAGLLEEHGTN